MLFTEATQHIPDHALVVEIGPHAILRTPLRQCRPDLPYISTMSKGTCAIQTLTTAVSDMWNRGVPLKWPASPAPSIPEGSEGMNAALSLDFFIKLSLQL